jgi:hypothetical protein
LFQGVEKKKNSQQMGTKGVRLFALAFVVRTSSFHPRHWLVYLADEPHNLTSGAVPSYHLLFFLPRELLSSFSLALILFFSLSFPSLATLCGDVGNYGTKEEVTGGPPRG